MEHLVLSPLFAMLRHILLSIKLLVGVLAPHELALARLREADLQDWLRGAV